MSLDINLVVLDKHPQRCAQAYADADLNALPSVYIETLRQAHIGRSNGPIPRHVLAKWALGQLQFVWLSWLIAEMLDEQWERFEACNEEISEELSSIVLTDGMQDPRDLPLMAPRFLQLIPYKIPGEPVAAYRKWYCENTEVPSWTYRGAPSWWVDPVQTTFNF
jgi:hypothetical protein